MTANSSPLVSTECKSRWPGRARLALTAASLALCTSLSPVSAKPLPATAHVRPARAWLNAGSMCVFRMMSKVMPADAVSFEDAFNKGWNKSLLLPAADVIDLQPGAYPNVQSLKIDLSQGKVNPADKSAPLEASEKKLTGESVSVDHFELMSKPLKSSGASINFALAADHVRLDYGKDKENRPILLMTDAKDGRVDFEVTRKDLESLMMSAAKESAGANGVSIQKITLGLESLSDHTVLLDLKVETLVGIVPAGLHMKARLDIDEQLNGRLSNVACSGDNLLGPLISTLIQPAIKKYNGKTRPLIRWPKDQIHLTDVKISGGENIKLSAGFGS